MTQEKWKELEGKFAPLGVTFVKEEFSATRCLRCSAEIIADGFYCDPCLKNSDPGALEYLKIQEAMCLLGKMILLEVSTKTENYCSPTLNPEFNEYIKECIQRDYEATGVTRNLGFKNPDAINFFRFFLGNGN